MEQDVHQVASSLLQDMLPTNIIKTIVHTLMPALLNSLPNSQFLAVRV